jgi:4-diphosphocytidyl-2-C-methyl-D-erythritol kinase
VRAHAKINLALVVGPTRDDGKHELVTVLQRIDLVDDVHVARTDRAGIEVTVSGSGVERPIDDNLVEHALRDLSDAAKVPQRWRAQIEKRIPIAAGLGGGSSDAAVALLLANEMLPEPLPDTEVHELAAALGADVPFFLASGPQLGTGDGSTLERLQLPQDYTVVLLLPEGAVKESTGAVYARFAREAGFEGRRKQVLAALKAGELAALPPNDLASSPLSQRLVELGAFRADVSGAGPAVYGLFGDPDEAERAAGALAPLGRTITAVPAW